MIHERLLRDYDSAMGTDSGGSRFTESEWGTFLSARLPVSSLASGSVAALAGAVDRFRTAHGLLRSEWALDAHRIAASFCGDRMMRLDGRPVRGFAELSGFFRTADGWVRTHANYPHHRAALISALELDPGVDAARLADRTQSLSGDDVEQRCASAGAIAVRVRTEEEWSASAGGLLADRPLVERSERSDPAEAATAVGVTADRPLAGIRVLDLTRVIAGPVASRALALLGATVLRVDSPAHPEIDWQHLENGQGKRTTLLDLQMSAGSTTFGQLLDHADVLVTGYRPGALERLMTNLPPGIVRGRVSAWGIGPWAERRGFDSIVQAASGISLVEGSTSSPGALPAQALDHASGYLLAAAIVDALAQRSSGSPGVDVSVSLARTASWLITAPGRCVDPPAATLPSAATCVTHGSVRTARPALASYSDYDRPAHPWGSDEPVFD